MRSSALSEGRAVRWALIVLAVGFLALLAINGLQAFSRRRFGHA